LKGIKVSTSKAKVNFKKVGSTVSYFSIIHLEFEFTSGTCFFMEKGFVERKREILSKLA